MANSCSVKSNALDAGTWSSSNPVHYLHANGNYYNNPAYFFDQAKQAISSGSPYYFDADTFAITCLSFPTAGDSTTIFGINAQIQAHTTAIANLQSQVTAVTNMGSASSPGFSERLEDQSSVWLLFLGALIAVACAKGIYNLFNRSPHAD